MNIKFNEYSIGIYALYTKRRVITDLYSYLPDGDEKIIFTGSNYKKGIAKELKAMFGDDFVLDSSLNPVIDLSEKFRVLEWIEKEYPMITVKNKELLCNLEWGEFSKLCKTGYFTGKISIGRGTSIYKLYENLANGNKKDRLELFYKLLEEFPEPVIESMILTFIRKSKMYDLIQASGNYKILLRSFFERNLKIDSILLSYAYKSSKYPIIDRLVWLLLNLK